MVRSRNKNSDTASNAEKRNGASAARRNAIQRRTNGSGEESRLHADSGANRHPLLQLQQQRGNQAVQRAVKERVQPKLEVGQPDDKYEREADRIARAVTANSDRDGMSPPSETTDQVHVQQMCTRCQGRLRQGKSLNCTDCEQTLQRKETSSTGRTVGSEVAQQIQSSRGQGRRLPDTVRATFEPQLGQDFGDVRIHDGQRAAELNRMLNARAFTRGQDIYFGAGNYDSDSVGGKRLLAHELTHVVQQRSSPKPVVRRQPETATAEPAAVTEVPVNTAVVETAISTIVDALEGFTSGDDSRVIRETITKHTGRTLQAIIAGVINKSGMGMLNALDWLLDDLADGDDAAVRAHIIEHRGAPDTPVFVGHLLQDRLEGYTSESDSHEIVGFFAPPRGLTGTDADRALTYVRTSAGIDRTELVEWLFGDLDRVNASHLGDVLASQGGPTTAGIVALWYATRIFELVAGYTSRTDSQSIATNFERAPPYLRPAVFAEFGALTAAEWQQNAEEALMEDMHPDDYETLRGFEGVSLGPYRLVPGESWLDSIGWGLDWIGRIVSWGICGIAGIVSGALSVIWEIMVSVWDLAKAVYHTVGVLLYLTTGGSIGRGSYNAYQEFFAGLGHLIESPGEAFDAWWNNLVAQHGTMEGPLTDCRQSEFIIRHIVSALINVILTFVGGYGAIKGAASAARGAATAARAGRLGQEVVSAGAKAGRRAVTDVAESVVTTAQVARQILSALRTPLQTIATVRQQLNGLILAARDPNIWAALRGIRGRLTERERRFWREQREFWQRDAARHESDLTDVERRAASLERQLEAGETPSDPGGELSEIGSQADRLDDDVEELSAAMRAETLTPTEPIPETTMGQRGGFANPTQEPRRPATVERRRSEAEEAPAEVTTPPTATPPTTTPKPEPKPSSPEIRAGPPRSAAEVQKYLEQAGLMPSEILGFSGGLDAQKLSRASAARVERLLEHFSIEDLKALGKYFFDNDIVLNDAAVEALIGGVRRGDMAAAVRKGEIAQVYGEATRLPEGMKEGSLLEDPKARARVTRRPSPGREPRQFQRGNFAHRFAERILGPERLPQPNQAEVVIDLLDGTGDIIRTDRIVSNADDGVLFEIKPAGRSAEIGRAQLPGRLEAVQRQYPKRNGWRGEVVEYTRADVEAWLRAEGVSVQNLPKLLEELGF